MIQNGVKKGKRDPRNYDYFKTKRLGTIAVSQLPAHFNVDAGFGMPDQNSKNPVWNIPALPNGCTGYTQSELCQDQDGTQYNPHFTYVQTPPHDIYSPRVLKDSLKTVLNKGVMTASGEIKHNREAYYEVRKQGVIDWFDAARMSIWTNQAESRSITVASPWYDEWQRIPSDGIMPVPSNYVWGRGVVGHNYKISGWKTINGVTYLVVKSWQGTAYGDNGWAYVSREIFNKMMEQDGCEMFVFDRKDEHVQTIDKTPYEQCKTLIQKMYDKLRELVRPLF